MAPKYKGKIKAIIDSMEIWTGLVCLVADPACKDFKRFGDGKGAYVNVVAWAESASHFEGRVTAIAAEQLDCIVREIEQIELLEAALHREECPDEFFTMRATAERQPDDVLFGAFHIWDQDDVN